MGGRAVYEYVEIEEDHVLIRDIGNHELVLTVTNDAENVVKNVYHSVGDKRIFYIDTDGDIDELVHDQGVFLRFAPARYMGRG